MYNKERDDGNEKPELTKWQFFAIRNIKQNKSILINERTQMAFIRATGWWRGEPAADLRTLIDKLLIVRTLSTYCLSFK